MYLSVFAPVCVHPHLCWHGLFVPFRTRHTFQDIVQKIDSVSLSVCLCVCTCVYLSVCTCMSVPICVPVCLCSPTPVPKWLLCPLQDLPDLPGHQTEQRHCESLCLSVCVPVCVHVCLCTCLSVYLSVFIHTCTGAASWPPSGPTPPSRTSSRT